MKILRSFENRAPEYTLVGTMLKCLREIGSFCYVAKKCKHVRTDR